MRNFVSTPVSVLIFTIKIRFNCHFIATPDRRALSTYVILVKWCEWINAVRDRTEGPGEWGRGDFNRSHRKPRVFCCLYICWFFSLVFHTCQGSPVWQRKMRLCVFCYFQGSAEALTMKLMILKLLSGHDSYMRSEFRVKTWSHGTQKHWKLTLFSRFKYF